MLFQNRLQDEENSNERLFSCFAYDSDGPGYPTHCHLHLEMVFQYTGCSTVAMDGQTRVLRAGDLAFFPMMAPHALGSVAGAKGVHIILQISPNYVNFATANAELVRRIHGGEAIKDGVAHLHQDSRARAMLEELTRECSAYSKFSLAILSRRLLDAPSYAALCRINGLAFLVISELISCGALAISDDENVSVNIRELDRLAPVLGRMVNHPELRFSLEAAAQMTSMSCSAFSRAFGRAIGQSFVNYQNMLRIRMAEDLLQSTDESITQIADRTNFGSLSYFNRVFKQINGRCPSAYRKSGGSK